MNFAAGGVATPADAALMMQLGETLILSSFSLALTTRRPCGATLPQTACVLADLNSPRPAGAGMDGVFVGSGIFKSGDPVARATAIVKAVTHYNDAKIIAEVSENLGEAMVGINPGEGFIKFSNRDS